jgi:hypothetical protein
MSKSKATRRKFRKGDFGYEQHLRSPEQQRGDIIRRYARIDRRGTSARAGYDLVKCGTKPVYDTAEKAQTALDLILTVSPWHKPSRVYECDRFAGETHFHWTSQI